MISKLTSTGRPVFLGVSNRTIAQMTDSQLDAELARVQSNLDRHARVSRELGRHYKRIDAVKAERRCLMSEKLRITREIERRLVANWDARLSRRLNVDSSSY